MKGCFQVNRFTPCFQISMKSCRSLTNQCNSTGITRSSILSPYQPCFPRSCPLTKPRSYNWLPDEVTWFSRNPAGRAAAGHHAVVHRALLQPARLRARLSEPPHLGQDAEVVVQLRADPRQRPELLVLSSAAALSRGSSLVL